jgi:polyisoprenoid-binding protein YceI
MSKTRPFAIAGLGAVLVLSPLAVVAQGAFSNDPTEVQAGDYRLDPGHSKITWSVDHFGFSTYVGQFSKVEGTLSIDPKTATEAKLDVTIDANSVGTLNPALFNLAGVNPVDRTYSLGFAGKAKIKRTDFGVSAYAPALGDEVTLELEAELKMIG